MNRINLFNPFSSKSEEHEDRLTWAFLVALKYGPLLQQFLRVAVARVTLEARDFPGALDVARMPATVSTQTKHISRQTERLVSVLLTDEPVKVPVEVQWSDRIPRYDGVVEYSDGMTLIIENKPSHSDVWQEQLSPSTQSFSDGVEDVTLHNRAVCLVWRDIVKGMLEHADSAIVSYGNRCIARDFLSYVEDARPDLTPYQTLQICGDNATAQRKWAAYLANQISGQVDDGQLEVVHDDAGGWIKLPGSIAERVSFTVQVNGSSRNFRISFWPADTVTQARKFFSALQKDDFLGLTERGWHMRPNLHFSYIGTHLVWTEAQKPATMNEYLAYFESGDYGQSEVDAEKLKARFDNWVNRRFASSNSWNEIEERFINTEREKINIIPGIDIHREWSLKEILELEKSGNLVNYLISQIDVALQTWGQAFR